MLSAEERSFVLLSSLSPAFLDMLTLRCMWDILVEIFNKQLGHMVWSSESQENWGKVFRNQLISLHPGESREGGSLYFIKIAVFISFLSLLWKSVITGKKIISSSFRTPPSTCIQMTDFVKSIIFLYFCCYNKEDKRENSLLYWFGIGTFLLIRAVSNWDITNIVHFQF